METQSEFDLSMPGGDTRDISASITTSRTPLAPSNRHNSSFSRPSDSSDASAISPAKHTHLATPHTTKRPLTLAAAVHNAQHNAVSHAQVEPETETNANAMSTSSSASSISDSPHLAKFPDPYSHVRSTSPPLTSTPQRTARAASTVGSRSRTIMTARPLRPSGVQDNASHRSDETTKTSTSRATRSARSASAVLDDLTESSIAPEDASDRESHTRAASPPPRNSDAHHQDGHDFVVHDAPAPLPTLRTSSPALSQPSSAAAADAIDWRQRRAQRRQLVQNDESAIDDDDTHTSVRDMATSQPTGTIATRAADSVAETDETATAYSSPAAARLARQGLIAATVSGSAAQPESTTSTPSRPLQAQLTTPKHGVASEERARMKQYLLNSVKATESTRSRTGRSSDAHIDAIERLKAQAQLHRTPGSLSEGDAATADNLSPATSADPTPRRRMDRLGKANTFAAGRTPLPKGGIAELLRRGALFGVSDSSGASSAAIESPLRAGPDAAESAKDDEVASVVGSTTTYSEASSNDLALAPNGSKHGAMGLRANTSFPGLGAADAGTEANSVARPRVDTAKLALYQSKLNARLDAENEELKRERDQLLQKLAQFEAGFPSQPSSAQVEAANQQLQSERERADALDREAQELADLLDEKERELEALRSSQNAPRLSDEREQQPQEEIQELQSLLKEREEDLEELEARLERERLQMEEQVQQAKAFSFQTLDKIETERDQALERVQALQQELSELRNSCSEPPVAARDGDGNGDDGNSTLRLRLQEFEAENERLNRELEARAESAKQTESEIESLREQSNSDAARIRGLERRLNAANAQLSKGGSSGDDASQSQAMELEGLRAELQEAQAYIAELEDRANQQKSSTSSSLQEEKIRFLERQKSELEDRVQQYREMISKGVGTNLANLSNAEGRGDAGSVPPVTPARTLGSSPLPKSVMSLRNISAVKTPRSPGPLSEASWLHNESSLGAANVVDRIAYLEGALDEANASIDAKLQQLDEAGVAHLTLAERLEQAHQRIAELEAEIERLRTLGGQSGETSAASPNKSVSQRQKVFADVHAQLEALKSRWAADHDKLQQRERDLERRERELQDRSTEKRQYQEVLSELNRFKEAASSLQQDLQYERAKQRSKLAETKAASHQKDSIEGSLSRTQAELDAVKRKLEQKMGGLQDLGRQYMEKAVQPDGTMGRRERAHLDSQTERLAEQFQAAQDEVEMLKAERNDLLTQRADLHKSLPQPTRTTSKCSQISLPREAH